MSIEVFNESLVQHFDKVNIELPMNDEHGNMPYPQ